MSEIEDDLRDLIERANATPRGKTCSSLWAKAATLAVEHGDDEIAVYCHLQLCSAYVAGNESTRVIAPFMWVHRTHQEHPEYFSEEALRAFAFAYDYMLRGVGMVPNVSVEQIEMLSTQMYQYFLQGGYPLRSYYLRRWQLLLTLGQEKEAEEEYARFLSTTSFDVVEATIRDYAVETAYHNMRGEWELAVAVGEKGMAIDGEIEENMREGLMSEMLNPLLYLGRDHEAWAYHVRSYRCHQQTPEYLEYLTDHMSYLALSGRAGRADRLERGLSILTRHMPWWTLAEAPRTLMNVARAAFILLDSFPADEDERVLNVTLPGGDLEWAEHPILENPTLAQAREWMKSLALKIADLFDARPGHPNPGYERTSVLRTMEPEAVPPLPEEGPLKDVTGLGDYTPLSQIIVNADASASSLSGGSATDSVAGTAHEQAHPEHEEDDGQPPYVPLQVNGPWTQMSFLELIDACARLGEYVPSIYYYEARERVCQDPSLAEDSVRSQLEDHMVQAWEWVVNDAMSASDYDYQMSEDRTICDDAAYMLIQESDDMLDARRYPEAAALADEAMRTPSVEPLGVRIRGLAGLSQAATSAGYYDEAIDATREGTNLSALLGLRIEQALAAGVLAETLIKQKCFVEAAEVAQNALDISDHYPHMYALRVSLHFQGGAASKGAKFYAAAGEHYLSAGHDLMEAGLLGAAAMRFEEAKESFTQGRQFQRGVEAYRYAVLAYRRHRDECCARLEDALRGEPARLEDSTEEQLAQSDVENAQEQCELAQEAYVRSLRECAIALAEQPGNVSDDDFAMIEQLMEEVYSIITSEDQTKGSKASQEVQEAQWHADMGKLMCEAYRFALAPAYLEEAVSRFAACGDVYNQADLMLMLAWAQGRQKDYDNARETLHRVCALEGASDYKTRKLAPLKRRAQEMLAELGEIS